MCPHYAEHRCAEVNSVAAQMIEDDAFSLPGSEDDSDDEIARMTLERDSEVIRLEEEQQLFLTKGISGAEEAAMPTDGVLIHKVYKTVHRATEDCDATCGIKVNNVNYYFSVDAGDLTGCKLCWRSGCAPWHLAATEAVGSERAPSDSEHEDNDAVADLFRSPAATPSM